MFKKSCCLLAWVFLLTGCVSVTLPDPVPLSRHDSAEQSQLDSFGKYRLQIYTSPVSEKILPTGKVRMPQTGEENAYGILTTPELETAYATFLGGDIEKSLIALNKAEGSSDEPRFLWQVSFLRTQALVMLGRAADAEEEIARTERLEINTFGHNWNGRALLGEIEVWLGDFDGAVRDLSQVIMAIGDWHLPTSYAMPPANIDKLVAVTTAQLRAYTSLAGAYLLTGDYANAEYWALEAEKRFNDVHYVANHPLYGSSVNLFADSYYGRAMNLAFLATARLSVTGDSTANDRLYNQANSLLKTIGYRQGEAILTALKTLGLYLHGDMATAVTEADKAINLANSFGLTDMIWRVETLRGKLLYKMGEKVEAEKVLRRAQASVDSMSGTLSTDRAKLRFGVGKEDITYYLVRIDLENKDYHNLFQDLERGRARAFVDMLAASQVRLAGESDLVDRIRELDGQIVRQKLIRMSLADDGDRQGVETTLERLLAARKELLAELRIKNRDLADVLTISSTTLDEVQNSLPPGAALLYALPAGNDEMLSLLLIERQAVEHFSLKITAGELRQKLDALATSTRQNAPGADADSRGLLIKKSAVSVRQAEDERQVAADLLRNLRPEKWQDFQEVYIVPSGYFYFIPWGILNVRIPVAVLPTAGWLTRETGSFGQHGAVIVGDPEFGGELVQLPGAKKEAMAVAAIYGISALTGPSASEKELRTQVGQGVEVLHLATHGVFRADRPLQSALFFSDKGKADPLTAQDIFEMPLPARLVVLSACETGLGREIAGNDMLGLIRSFYLSGAVSVLSSLWPVDDDGTRLFMQVFHEQAKGGNYGRAWLAARDAVREAGFSSWIYGAFVLGGRM